jgi:hypothetical protein
MEAMLERPEVARSPVARELAAVLTRPTGRTSAGFPYLHASAWTRFRDWVPHLLANGPGVLEAVDLVERAAGRATSDEGERRAVSDAARVVRQVVMTAAITAPSDLWLLRYVLAALRATGVAGSLLAGETVVPEHSGLVARELAVDLRFLLARGYLLGAAGGAGYRLAPGEHARRALEGVGADDAGPDALPAALSQAWARVFRGDASTEDRDWTGRAAATLPNPSTREPGVWSATPEEVEIGFRLVPLIVGLQAAGRTAEIARAGAVDAGMIGAPAIAILHAAGVADAEGRLGELGTRVLERGPGPMGIIEAYHPYLDRLPEILKQGRGVVWVQRSANVAASQLANRKSFEGANDALDRLSAATGFTYSVFIEHALGRGEATRQRYERSGDEAVAYVGADLEDAAIDAAVAEQAAGRLPGSMRFVRNADIGRPEVLLDHLAKFGLPSEGAVMMVGNGFHEVREATDDSMAKVFGRYCRAGIVLLFTEETALAVEDLLETAWNTYHAGFKYVHERSGQGLRPSGRRPPSPFEERPPASWSELASRGGYVRAGEFCVRSRTVYPYPPPTGHNPSISVTHVFVPGALAARLGVRG